MDMNIFKTNANVEVTGVWHDLGDGKIKIARYNNPVYQKAIRRLTTPFANLINAGTDESADKASEITIEAMAEAIVVDWKDVTDEGTPLEYSKENAVILLTKYPDFREWVSLKATSARFYRDEYLEKTGKK